MRHLLKYFFLTISFGTIQAQIVTGDEFYVGKHFLKNECRVETYPDWGRITFLTDKVFLVDLAIKDNQQDSSFLIGKWELRDSILTLKSIRSAMPIWWSDSSIKSELAWYGSPNYDNVKHKMEHFSNLKFDNARFKISKCGDDIIMTQLGKRTFWYASRDRKSTSGYWTKRFKEKGLWDRITNYSD